MNSRRALWLAGMAGLVLLLVSLGCTVCCPFVPQPPTATPSPLPPPIDTSTPELAPTPDPTSTPTAEAPGEMIASMLPYADPLAGFALQYPAGWTYQVESGGVYFAETEEALAYADPVEQPVLAVRTIGPQEMEQQLGPGATAGDLLDSILDDLRGEDGFTLGEFEAWDFGDVPGVGVEVGWIDEWTDIPIRGYIVTAAGEGVAGIGLGASQESEWPSYGLVFKDVFASLEFFPPEVPEPVERGTIQPGEVVQGVLLLGGTDVWHFDAQEGQYITIGLDAVDPDALDTYLELHGEDGLLLAEDDDGGEGTNARLVDFPVFASGTYVIYALTYSGEGDYALSLEVADEPTIGGAIEYDQTVEETLGQDVEHGWLFQGSEGDVVTIAMNAPGDDLDCYLVLYGPDGVPLTDDDDSGRGLNALIEYYELPVDGTYRIVAQGALFETVGMYELTLERTEMVVEGVLTYGDTLNATLKRDQRHHWLFEGRAGDVVTISMTASIADMDTFLELFAPDGVRVLTDDDGGGDSNAQISAFELPLSGTYRIIARGYSDEDVGEYKLTLTGP